MNKRKTLLLAAAVMSGLGVHAATLEDWAFENHAPGLSLSETTNSVSGGSVFSPASEVTQTDGDGYLFLTNEVDTAFGEYWTGGEEFTADIEDADSTSVRYLRYDLRYDLEADKNYSGTLVGASFTDGTGANWAGFALAYDVGVEAAPPTGLKATTVVEKMDEAGSLSAIAKVDLAAGKMYVWYDVTGAGVFDEANANFTNDVTLTAITDLHLMAYGDLIDSDDSDRAVEIDNIRVASTWDRIIDPVADAGSPPSLDVLDISDRDLGGMISGTTNVLTAVIRNSYSESTGASSELSWINDKTGELGPGAFTVIASNTVAQGTLIANQLYTNTYTVVANEDGDWLFSVTGVADGLVGDPSTHLIAVGKSVSYDSFSIVSESGGVLADEIEYGETVVLDVVTRNTGGLTVNNVTNRLVSSSPYVTVVSPEMGVDASLVRQQTATTQYTLKIAEGIAHGTNTLTMINSIDGGDAWTNDVPVMVVKEARTYIDKTRIELSVPAGRIMSDAVTLYNDGNIAAPYVMDDSITAPTTYESTAQLIDFEKFQIAEFPVDEVEYTWSTRTNSLISSLGTTSGSWYEEVSEYEELGFDFYMFGVPFQKYSVSDAGSITLTNETLKTWAIIDLLDLDSGEVSVDTIRNRAESDKQIVAWGNEGNGVEDAEYQAWLNTDSTFELLYRSSVLGDEDTLTIMLSHGTGTETRQSETFTYNPKEDVVSAFEGDYTWSNSLKFDHVTQMDYTEVEGSVPAQSNLTVTVAFDGSQTSYGENEFVSYVLWGDGEVDSFGMNVEVVERIDEVLAPDDVSVVVPSGELSSWQTFSVTNNSSYDLDFIFSDRTQSLSGYYVNESAQYQWVTIPPYSEYMVSEDVLDGELQDIGFPFTYFGTSYEEVRIFENGQLKLGENRYLIALGDDLIRGDDSDVMVLTSSDKSMFTVTWSGLIDSRFSTDEYTFQIVLYRDGRVQYNYATVGSAWQTAQVALQDGSSTLIEADLENEDTVTYDIDEVTETVQTEKLDVDGTPLLDAYGNVWMVDTDEEVTTYVTNEVSLAERISTQALAFYPREAAVYEISPSSGSLASGDIMDFDVRFDARDFSQQNYETSIDMVWSTAGQVDLLGADGNTGNNWTRVIENPVDPTDEYYSDTNTVIYESLVSATLSKPARIYSDGVLMDELDFEELDTAINSWAWIDNKVMVHATPQANPYDNADFDPDDYSKDGIWAGCLIIADYDNEPIVSIALNAYIGAASTSTAVSLENAFGSDDTAISINKDDATGANVISWADPDDSMSRTYQIWYKTDLSAADWTYLDEVTNGTSYLDEAHIDVSPIFYRVSVK